MKLAVSNIAWPATDRDAAYTILKAAGIRGLEIAPGLMFDGAANAFAPTEAEAASQIAAMRNAGLELVSMQSLLFNVQGAALFEGDEALGHFRAGLRNAIALAGRFSIPNLVFGSPRQRNIPEGVTFEAAERLALDVFRELGDAAAKAGTRLAMESNPAGYGTNFLNTMAQAEAFVRRVDHPAITLMLDIGSMHMNGDFDQIEDVVSGAVDLISHVHVSEPDLAPAPADVAQAARAFSALTRAGYAGWCSIEMKAPPTDGLETLSRSVDRLLAAAELARSAP